MAIDENTKRKVDAIREPLDISSITATEKFSDFKADAHAGDMDQVIHNDSRLRDLLTQLRLKWNEHDSDSSDNSVAAENIAQKEIS